MRNIKKGQLYQKGKHGEIYKILNVSSEKINGFVREEVLVGCLKNNQAVSIPASEISDRRIWKDVSEKNIRTQIVERKIMRNPDGSVTILSETVVSTETAKEVNIKNAISNKKYPDTALGKAMNEAVSKAEAEKIVNIGQITNIHETSKDDEVKPKPDHTKFGHIKYDSLDLLGQVYGQQSYVIKHSSGKFHKGMATLHQQCLDRFRDGDITLYDLRKYSPNSKTGKALSLEGTIARLNKAIWHYGNHNERKHYGW